MSLWEFFFSISCCATQFQFISSSAARHKTFHTIHFCGKSNVMFWFYFDNELNNFYVTMEIVLWSMKSLRKSFLLSNSHCHLHLKCCKTLKIFPVFFFFSHFTLCCSFPLFVFPQLNFPHRVYHIHTHK